MTMISKFEQTIAILGLGGAGKSVFLTSLIDHLRNNDPELMRIDESDHEGRVSKFKECAPSSRFKAFPYLSYRARLCEHQGWPNKTCDVMQYLCEFQPPNLKRKLFGDTIKRRFIDIPGERLADLVMENRNYAEWSDEVLKIWEADKFSRDKVGKYLEYCEQSSCKKASVLGSFKDLLWHLYSNYIPFVTPSIFALDSEGTTPGDHPQGFGHGIQDRITGAGKEGQFAPLSGKMREAYPELAATFTKHYKAYVREVPAEIFNTFAKCHRLIALVDIPVTLAAGVQRYNCQSKMLRNALEACKAGKKGRLRKLFAPVSSKIGMNRGITRVAMVATKSDLVRVGDQDNLMKLLQQMTGKILANFNVKAKFFTCAAVKSTTPAADEQGEMTMLAGHLRMNEEGKVNPPPKRGQKPIAFYVSPLPGSWPDSWTEKDYIFPEVYPRFPSRLDRPPDQEGLGPILNFLLTEDLLE